MFKDPAILISYFKYSVLPALVASAPIPFFLRDARFSETWLLYLGNAIFLGSMIVVMLILSRKANYRASTGSLLIAGHAITVFAIIIICLISFMLLLLYIPDLLHIGNTEKALKRVPANSVFDKTHGIMFILFIDAVIGTFSAGSFATLMMSYATKRNQKGDKAEL